MYELHSVAYHQLANVKNTIVRTWNCTYRFLVTEYHSQNCLESFEICCRRTRTKIRPKEETNILPTTKRRKANWIGHLLRRNCLLRHAVEGNKGRGNEEEDVSGYWILLGYWKLKEEAVDRTV